MVVHPGMMYDRIKEHRARLALRQEELARMVGVRRETISDLEKGKYDPSLVLARNTAQIFGVSIEEAFTVTEEQRHFLFTVNRTRVTMERKKFRSIL